MTNFLDKTGLSYFWSKIKEYIGRNASKVTVSFSEGNLTITTKDASEEEE